MELPFKFKPKDFREDATVSDLANIKLAEWFKDAKRVYTSRTKDRVWDATKTEDDHYQAWLIGIEPIKKCEHKNPVPFYAADTGHHWCTNCKTKLKPVKFEKIE